MSKEIAKLIRSKKTDLFATMENVMDVIELHNIDAATAMILQNTILEQVAELVEEQEKSDPEPEEVDTIIENFYHSPNYGLKAIKQSSMLAASKNASTVGESANTSKYIKTVVRKVRGGNLIERKEYKL